MVGGILGDLPGPRAEAAVVVDGFHPFIEEAPLHLVLLQILSLELKNHEFPGYEVNQRIRSVGRPLETIGHIRGVSGQQKTP